MDINPLLNAPALARVADDLRRLVQPAIRLEFALAEKPLPVGTTRIGGDPDLLPETEWPTMQIDAPPPSEAFRNAYPQEVVPDNGIVSLPFVAQVRLADVAALLPDSGLPADGLLLLFYSDQYLKSDTGSNKHVTDNQTGITYGYYGEGSLERWRVLYVPESETTQLVTTASPHDVPQEARYKPCGLTRASAELTLPAVETCYIGEPDGIDGVIRLTQAEWNEYADLQNETQSDSHYHRMLGHWDNPQPYTMEGAYAQVRPTFTPERAWDALSPDEKQQEYAQVRLLLQLEPNDSGMWFGRAGVLFFYIRESDLRERDFSRVWAATQ